MPPRGGVIGMTTFGPQREVLVIPHATIARTVQALLASGHVARGWLGATLQPVAVPETQGEERKIGHGLMVMATSPGSPAEAAGLLPGDIVVAVDGQPLSRKTGLTGRLGPDSIGSVIELRLLRGGALVDQSLTIAERPPE